MTTIKCLGFKLSYHGETTLFREGPQFKESGRVRSTFYPHTVQNYLLKDPGVPFSIIMTVEGEDGPVEWAVLGPRGSLLLSNSNKSIKEAVAQIENEIQDRTDFYHFFLGKHK